MPRTGKPFSVRMSNCGPLGWVSDKAGGYRYQAQHPLTGRPWPSMPELLLEVWREVADYPVPPRRKRPRRPCEGMLLHQDGSRHEWLADEPPLDLIVTMDDATSTIYSAFLVEEEGTASSFKGLMETFASKGLPSSLYTDRGSHYFYTAEGRRGGRPERA